MNKNTNKQYDLMELRKEDLDSDPFVQFDIWFSEASKTDIKHPHAMTLSTSNLVGIPTSRMVLLKGVDEKGFRFYTNENSNKGKELILNPYASLCFWWEPLERQVRIDGKVEILSSSIADEYFSTRPRGSQIGAWASDQSSIVESRKILEKKFMDYKKKFEGQDIPRPDCWKGYRLIPNSFEFWQGRPDRLHDRLRYRLENAKWIIERLEP